jgi:hypothetical protein
VRTTSVQGLRDRMLTWVIVVILVTGVWCEDVSLPEVVRTLKSQVSALLEDSALLVRKSEVLELREELAALRYSEQFIILYFSILLHCIVQWVLRLCCRLRAALLCWFSLSFTTCFCLHGHLQVCRSFIVLVSTVFHYMFRPTWPSSSVFFFPLVS